MCPYIAIVKCGIITSVIDYCWAIVNCLSRSDIDNTIIKRKFSLGNPTYLYLFTLALCNFCPPGARPSQVMAVNIEQLYLEDIIPEHVSQTSQTSDQTRCDLLVFFCNCEIDKINFSYC